VYIGGNFEENHETDIQCVAIGVKSNDQVLEILA
jgi:hypothetical protein